MKTNIPQFLLGLLLCLVVGCGSSPATRIERVLNQCEKISAKAGAYTDGATQAAYVAREFQAIDVRGCPPEFRVAFQEHINAWNNAQMAFAQNTATNNIIEGVVAAVKDDYSGLGAANDNASSATQYVNATYYRLAAIAAAYGARVP